MILCNGLPKSGTHALVKAVELLGCVDVRQDHIPYTEGLKVDKHLYIQREPRNMLVSWVRFAYPTVTKGYLIGAIKNYGSMKMSLPEAILRFDSWEHRKNVLVVEFESLIENDREMRRIAEYLEAPFLDDAFENLPGGTATWTGKLSRWEDYWCPEIDEIWNEYFGISDQNKVVSL